MREAIRVTLITRDDADRIHCETVGDFSTVAKAMAAAKRAAGQGAKFQRRGITMEYVGPLGTAHIGKDARPPVMAGR